MRLTRKAGTTLWNGLTTLPLAAGITGEVGGEIEKGNTGRAEWGWLEIWRSDLVKATSILTLAGNATQANAALDLAGPGTNIDTVIQDRAAGVGGNSTTIAFADGSAVDEGELDESAYPVITFAFKNGVTTVADFEAAVLASTHLAVKVAGTGASVLVTTDDEFAAEALTGGAVAETATIGSTVYRYVNFLAQAFDVLIGAAATNTIDNLIAAVNLAAGEGTLYGTSTTVHPTVTAAVGAGDTMGITAKTGGLAGNAIATTETMAQGSWTSTVMAGGQDQNTTDSTITGAITLWGHNGTRWLSIQVLEATSLAVSGVRGKGYFLRGMGVYTRLALSAGGATPSGTTPAISASYSPVFSAN